MSENENLTPEELPIEDQKKAINLQDLVYIKKYIDDSHYDKEETDSLLDTTVKNETDKAIKENCYTKSEIDTNHYTKTETDETFYKRTDEVSQAINATNAVVKTDGSHIGLTLDEGGVLKFNDDETVLKAENAVNATNAILSADGKSYTGVRLTGNGGLKLYNEFTYIPLRKLIYLGVNKTLDSHNKAATFELEEQLANGDKIEIVWNLKNNNTGVTYVKKASSIGYWHNDVCNDAASENFIQTTKDINLSAATYLNSEEMYRGFIAPHALPGSDITKDGAKKSTLIISPHMIVTRSGEADSYTGMLSTSSSFALTIVGIYKIFES